MRGGGGTCGEAEGEADGEAAGSDGEVGEAKGHERMDGRVKEAEACLKGKEKF